MQWRSRHAPLSHGMSPARASTRAAWSLLGAPFRGATCATGLHDAFEVATICDQSTLASAQPTWQQVRCRWVRSKSNLLSLAFGPPRTRTPLAVRSPARAGRSPLRALVFNFLKSFPSPSILRCSRTEDPAPPSEPRDPTAAAPLLGLFFGRRTN